MKMAILLSGMVKKRRRRKKIRACEHFESSVFIYGFVQEDLVGNKFQSSDFTVSIFYIEDLLFFKQFPYRTT